MEKNEHIIRHKELHKALDELIADWITQTGRRPSEGKIIDLMTWSHEQTINPTEEKNGNK